jgi:hypothetical protein
MRGLAFVAVALNVAVTVSAAAAKASPSLDPHNAFVEGRLAYERGDYADAVATLGPLVYPTIELDSEDAVVETHRLLALSYYFMKREPEAEQEVAALLTLRPSYELDPVVDPPAAVRFFHSIRLRQEDRLREIRQRQLEEEERKRREQERRAEEAHAKAERVYVERTVEHHSRWVALVPLGVGQFYNHHKLAGALFLGSQALMAVSWSAFTLAIYLKYPNGTVPQGEIDEARTLQGLQIGSGAAFWALVVAGIIDAQVRFVSQFVTDERELPRPPEKKKVSLLPMFAPGLYGLGVQGAW